MRFICFGNVQRNHAGSSRQPARYNKTELELATLTAIEYVTSCTHHDYSMKRALAIAVVCFVHLFSALAESAAARPAAKPNFVFILADDLGFMDIHANNSNTFYQTPHLDRLAAEGMRFTSAYAAGPVCSPTNAG